MVVTIRITKSLLNSWLWLYKKPDGYTEFLDVLNRVKTPPTEAQQRGSEFEAYLNNHLNGIEIPTTHEWHDCVVEMAKDLYGSAQQVTLYKAINLDGEQICLHGVLDFLKAGVITDCKFSQRYGSNGNVNAYLGDTQAPMYFRLTDGAYKFVYLISDGKYVYRETYTPDEVTPIETHIRHFIRFVKERGLWDVYKEKWRYE